MAALLVGLRLKQLGRSLTRSPWHIVGLVFGALGALWMLGLVAVGAVGLRLAPEGVAPLVLVLVTSVAVVGWAVGALLSSTDESLAPERFALLPVRARQLLPGLALAQLLGIGGVATAIALALLLIAWSASVPALVAAIVMLPVALLTCMLGARVLSGVLARTLASRRTRDVATVVLMVLLISSGLLLSVVARAIAESASVQALLEQAAGVLAWTPLGATAGVPAAIATGDWLAAGIRLVIALGTVALLWWAWGAQLAARLVEPVQASGGGRVRSGGIVDRLVPATPTGAVAARSIRLFRRDPRHLLNAIATLVLPLILVGTQVASGVLVPELAAFLPLIMALIVGQIAQLALAYDKDALALHVLTGVPGRADRAGRLLAMAIVLGPSIVLASVLVSGITGRWDLLPASLGASVSTSLVAAGVGIAVGAFLPGRAPAPEQGPFGRGSSGGAQSFAAMGIMLPVIAVAGAPATVLAVLGVVWMPWLGWLALPAGLAIGGVAVWLGIRIGGDRLDRAWPEVLAAVSSD
ncbi:hypothetical protein [Agrococcus jejuensis]|uniref:ABC-2 type transport system permease protein n=1 Tax=Agrococcus jejuensis TaxID=399736 RepID=A0A1G8G6M6_9MICO|nr:hypothetical protein [Agrococcus jejuensis]SDH89960.1 ABC-2 type transport system permease protein [Agrococcus jejuensis]